MRLIDRKLLAANYLSIFVLLLFSKSCLASPSSAKLNYVKEIIAQSRFTDGFVTKDQARSALADLTRQVNDTHADWTAYYVRALAYRKLQKPEEALADAIKSSELAPNQYLPVRLHAKIENDLFEEEEAIKYFTLAIRLAPQERQTLLLERYHSYERVGKYKLATEDLENYVKGHPELNTEDIQRSLGLCSLKSGDAASAVKYFSKAISMRENIPKVHYHRANAYMILKKYKEAIADFTFEVKRGRMPAEVLLGERAKAYRLTGDVALAKIDEANLKNISGELYDSAPFRRKP